MSPVWGLLVLVVLFMMGMPVAYANCIFFQLPFGPNQFRQPDGGCGDEYAGENQ